ncbi:MAG: hypothetical protein AABX94_03230 [Nanoarchaeota archaeon]
MKSLKFWIIVIGIIAIFALILSIVALKRSDVVRFSSLSEDLGGNVNCEISCENKKVNEVMSREDCKNYCDKPGISVLCRGCVSTVKEIG